MYDLNDASTPILLKRYPLSFEKLAAISNTASFSFWTYRQIQHFLLTHATITNWTKLLTPFESLCFRKLPQRHLISYIYTLLSDDAPFMPAPSQVSWERNLQIPLTEEAWDTVHEYTHKGYLNIAIQENCYRVVTRWYRTPSCLHKSSLVIPNTWWRCCKTEGTMLHVWWECEPLQPFWKEAHDLIVQVTTITLEYTPAQFLLHHTTLSKKDYFKSLAMHVVNAARPCIPIHWRSTRAFQRLENGSLISQR